MWKAKAAPLSQRTRTKQNRYLSQMGYLNGGCARFVLYCKLSYLQGCIQRIKGSTCPLLLVSSWGMENDLISAPLEIFFVHHSPLDYQGVLQDHQPPQTTSALAYVPPRMLAELEVRKADELKCNSLYVLLEYWKSAFFYALFSSLFEAAGQVSWLLLLYPVVSTYGSS